MLSELADADKVIGIKQTKKAIKEGLARRVYVAMDADVALRDEIISICSDTDVEFIEVSTMEELGESCGIQVGAACAATL